MSKLENSTIDLILTDLPYGVTQNKADICLPLDSLWIGWKRLLRPKGTVILTSQFPYSLDVILSNRKWFKYDLIWDKVLVSGFLNANKMPLRTHEHILVFYESTPQYYPQKTIGIQNHPKTESKGRQRRNYGKIQKELDNSKKYGKLKFPQSIIRISKQHPSVVFHPTEKPVALAEFLISNYTVKNMTVLDSCMGVGWTAIACKKLDRNFIGIDINPVYIKEANRRLKQQYL